jgi:hypothetical protein
MNSGEREVGRTEGILEVKKGGRPGCLERLLGRCSPRFPFAPRGQNELARVPIEMAEHRATQADSLLETHLARSERDAEREHEAHAEIEASDDDNADQRSCEP